MSEFKRVSRDVDDLKFRRKFRLTREYIRDVKKDLDSSEKAKDKRSIVEKLFRWL